MGGFLRFAVSMDFLQELLVAALLFLLPLKKRRLWGGRFALGAFACILASYLIQLPLSARPMNSAALPLVLSYLLFQLGAVVLVFWHAADLSLYDALYGTICAYAVQHFTTSAALIFPQTTATSTIFGVRMQAEQSRVGKVLSSWAIRPPMLGSLSTRSTSKPAPAISRAA